MQVLVVAYLLNPLSSLYTLIRKRPTTKTEPLKQKLYSRKNCCRRGESYEGLVNDVVYVSHLRLLKQEDFFRMNCKLSYHVLRQGSIVRDAQDLSEEGGVAAPSYP